MDNFVVTSTGWNPNYLPHNIADHLGYFDQVNLRVVRRPQNPWEGVLDDLASGAADIALGGSWVPAMYHGIGKDFAVVGQMNGRYAQLLMTRDRVDAFDWSWLRGRTVVIPGAGGTAGYTYFTGMMREHGIDPAQVRFVRDLSTKMLAELFAGGLGDAILADPYTSFTLERNGVASIACRLATTGGPLPNSVYYARRDRLDEIVERLGRFLTAIQRAMWQSQVMSIEELTKIAIATWPDLDPGILKSHVTYVRDSRTWESTRVDQDALERWTRFQYAIPIIRSLIPYNDLVDTRGMDAVPARDSAKGKK